MSKPLLQNSSLLYLFNNNTLLSGGNASFKRYYIPYSKNNETAFEEPTNMLISKNQPIKKFIEDSIYKFDSLDKTPMYDTPGSNKIKPVVTYRKLLTPMTASTADLELLTKNSKKDKTTEKAINSAIDAIDNAHERFTNAFKSVNKQYLPKFDAKTLSNAQLAELASAENQDTFTNLYMKHFKITSTLDVYSDPAFWYFETFQGFLLFPNDGTYTFNFIPSYKTSNLVINIREINTGSGDIKYIVLDGDFNKKSSIPIRKNIYYEFTVFYRNQGGEVNKFNSYTLDLIDPNNNKIDISKIIYTICDDNTLTNCKYVDKNNLVLIDGMLLQRFYSIKDKSSLSTTSWKDTINIDKKKLVKSEYSSLLNFSSSINNVFGKEVDEVDALMLIIDGYIDFPLGGTYRFRTTYNKKTDSENDMAIFLDDMDKYIDMTEIGYLNKSHMYSARNGNIASNEFTVTGRKKISIVLLLINKIVTPIEISLINTNNNIKRELSITPSWLSADYNNNFLNEYRDTVMAKCGNDDKAWATTGCTDIFNKNMTNILQSKNKTGNIYSKLIIDNCKSASPNPICSNIYNAFSPDQDIFIDYCKKGNNYINDINCVTRVFESPFKYPPIYNKESDITDNFNKALDYCRSSYERHKGIQCQTLYQKLYDLDVDKIRTVQYPDIKKFYDSNDKEFCSNTSAGPIGILKDKNSNVLCSTVFSRDIKDNAMLKKIYSECSKSENLFSEECAMFNNEYTKNKTDISTSYLNSYNQEKINYCTDDRINGDLNVNANCVPFLNDESMLSVTEDRIINYCETNDAYTNEVCKNYYGKSVAELNKIKNTYPLLNASVNEYVNNKCIKDFTGDDTCKTRALESPGLYALPAVKYCNLDDNLATEFCNQMYHKLLDTSNYSISEFDNKESFYQENKITIIISVLVSLLLLLVWLWWYKRGSKKVNPESPEQKKQSNTSLTELINRLKMRTNKSENAT